MPFQIWGKINLKMHTLPIFNDENYVLNLKYGMDTLPNIDKDLGHLIIDLHIISNNIIGFNDIPKEITLLNDEIYNVFSWVINEDAKKIINDENFK